MIPFILAAAAVAKGVSAVSNFISQRKEGAAAFKQGEMERTLYGKNADLAEQQAKDAEARGEEASLRQSYKMKTLQGAQVTALAGQGITLTGTAAEVIKGDQALGEADRQTILENARREAWGFRQQEDIYRYRGDIAFQAGKNQRTEKDIESVGTLANYAGDMFNLFKQGTS